ncbi:MAG TPA: ribonuclease J, partial [Thermomicrobiales bacterium]|nr:ribonuclease J [Thermomicrobiales bacterium]
MANDANERFSMRRDGTNQGEPAQPGENRPPSSRRRRPAGRRPASGNAAKPSEAARPPAEPAERGRGQQRRRRPPATGADGAKPAARQGGRRGEAKRPAADDGGSGLAGPRGKLRIIPLGGVGEIGKNMTLVEYERDMVMLDCGAKFPEEDQRGIDLIIPDVRYVRERLANLRAILITHGHEDHIGGLPYILPQFKSRAPIPIYGSPLALGFIEKKLNESRLDKLASLRPVESGERVQLGQLSAQFIHVTHSIPDTNAIAITSPVGTIVDTADFKFDPTPVMGAPTDERLLRQVGERGVLALLSDTTRVENAGSTPSEKVVLDTIDATIRDAKGQVIIA